MPGNSLRALVLPLCLAICSTPASAQSRISGTARAGDGDSLTVSGISVRLFGIDAPELSQTCRRGATQWKCGEEAKSQLQAMLDGQQVSCRSLGTDDYGRALAVCTAGKWELNRAMVQTGWATAFRRYSDAYVAEEIQAKTAGVGIWSSEFEAPEDYRHGKDSRQAMVARPARPVVRQSANPSTGCLIKGNHSRRGEWIYHQPGMPYYDQTRAEEMFCSEADAQAAGYRRSRAQR